MKRVYVLLFVFVFLVSCVETSDELVPENKVCNQDSDCVASSCCHPTDAVNKEFAPDCAGVMCTMECAPGTLDCGQGQVRCIDNVCTVVIE